MSSSSSLHQQRRTARTLTKCFILWVSLLFICILNIGWSCKFMIRDHLHSSHQRHIKHEQQNIARQQLHRKQNDNNNIAVFYNLYISSESDVGRVARTIVDEQFQFFQPYHYPIYIHSIGHPLPQLFRRSIASSNINDSNTENEMEQLVTTMPNVDVNRTVLLGHHETGSELVSLQSLWEYCKNSSSPATAKVVYLHSKVMDFVCMSGF